MTRRRRPTTHSRRQAGTVEPIDGEVVSDLTLAGPASDPGGDRRSGTRKKSLAGDPGGDGGRPWRGATLALQDVAPSKNHMARCGPH